MAKGERVFVVAREDLFSGESFRGFRSHGLSRLLDRIGTAGTFRDRSAVEDDPGWKQIIPYAVVCAGTKVLLLRRKRSQTESRLHRKASIGVGGHINPTEETASEFGSAPLARALRILEAGLRREIAEEVHLPAGSWAEPAGMLNDDETAVGQVHFGIVYRVSIPEPAVSKAESLIREVDLMEGRLVDRADLLSHASEMETWSHLLLDAVLEWPAGSDGGPEDPSLGIGPRIILTTDFERAG